MVLYSAPGVGKTTLLSSLVREGKEDETLIIDIDRGARVITNVRPDAHVVRIDSFLDLDELYRKLKTGDPEYASYKTVCIDTITKGERILLWDILKRKGKTLPTIDNFGERSARMAEFIQEWRSLERNVIFVCHEQEIDVKEETPNGEDVIITRKMPAMSGKMAQTLCAEVDLVLRLCLKEVVDSSTGKKTITRVLQSFKTDSVHAKDRSGNLAPFEAGNLRTVMEKWYSPPVRSDVVAIVDEG